MKGQFSIVVAILCALSSLCQAQWVRDIACPVGTAYVDLRPDAGREEFCERHLPGSLRVKHGPYRFWFSADNPGDRGSYENGRQVGPWKECNRFGRCAHHTYPLAYPEEEDRPGFLAKIPVSYKSGKYIFDFRSCWSTWITQAGGEDINLNIGSSGYRCEISYIPQQVMEHGGEGTYTCFIPFSVGERSLDSLDLMRELPRLGLPRFCRLQTTKAEALMVVDRDFRNVATSVDLTCAAVQPTQGGGQSLMFRLNKYAADLANEISTKNGPLITRICLGPNSPSVDQPTQITSDSAGRLFLYRLSDDPQTAYKQKRCLAKSLPLVRSCQ